MSKRGCGWLGVNIVLLCSRLLFVVGGNALVSSQALPGIAVRQVQPARLTQFIRTTVTVSVNSSLCESLGQDDISNAQLIIPAAAADGSELVFRSGASMQDNCTSLQFRVLLGREAQAGQYPAYVLFDSLQRSLQLPVQITVLTLPMLSMKSRYINVPADQSAFAVPVGLSYPAGDGGVTVRLQAVDSSAAKVWDDTLSWPQGASGTQAFRVNLQYVPSDIQLTMELVQPQSAVVDPAASSTTLLVQSPIVGFKTGLGYYRGTNSSSAPLLYLTVSGTSAFLSQFNYTTYLLPGSRPYVPCHPLASTCSVAEVESVASVKVSGIRYLQPGQQQIEPIQLPISWSRLPPEAELRVGIKIVGISNVQVAVQQGQVAAIIFGTPTGRCPPGSTLLSDTNSSRSSDGPTYTSVAALQELALAITAAVPSSSNDSCGSNSTLAAAAAAAQGSASSSSEIALDLDPPFSPMVDKYVGLLPPKPKGKGKLLLASSRWGDVVVVDATACLGLNSSRFQVQWWKPQQMWRQQYSLTGQRVPCWLRVHVFTKTDDAMPVSIYDSSNSSSSSFGDAYSAGNTSSDPYSSSGNSSTAINTSSSAWDLPDDYVLYRTYTIRYVPLKSPEQLSLQSITFSNNDTTVIACGVPRALSHLFQTAPLPSLSSIMGMDGNSSSSSSNSSSTISSRSDLNSLLAPGVAGHPRISGGPATLVSNSDSSSTDSPVAEADRSEPQQLIPAAGQVVQVAYLVMPKTAALTDDLDSSSNTSQQHQQPAAVAGAGSQSGQEQYSLYDADTNRTIVWSKFTTVDCAQDRYVLLSLAQLRSDMKMVPELLDPNTEGVDIKMTQAALALSSSIRGSQAAAEAVDTSSSDGSNSSSLSQSSSWELAVKSSIFGTNKLQTGLQGLCSISAAKGAAASSIMLSSRAATANSSSSGSRDPCALQLPGVTAEVPVILTADEGRSSKTYTLLVYSNESAAAVVQNLVLPQEAAAAESAAKTAAAAGNGSSSSPAADAAVLTAAYFAGRPKEWPASPAQSDKCALCPNGTYSTKVDAYDCKVCPPGKYAASPFSTSCLFCPPGTFSYYWGAPACRKCLPGTSAAHIGSLFCDICKDGTTTYSEGSTTCDVTVRKDASALDALPSTNGSEYALLLSFGVVLDGALLETVSRSTTGINGSSEGIVSVLIRSDTATALNVTLGSVQVNGVQQLDSRQLLINVSAAVPVPGDQAQQDGPTQEAQDLAADELIQRLIDDPNTFLRTTQTLGAEGVSVQDLITLKTRRNRLWYTGKLHAILWPSLIGSLIVLGLLAYLLWRWRQRRRVHRLTQQLAGGLEFAAVAAADGAADLLHTVYNPWGVTHGGVSRRPGLGVCGLGLRGSVGGFGTSLQDLGLSHSHASAVDALDTSGSSRRSGWQRNWQQFWGSGVRVVVDASNASSQSTAVNMDSPTHSTNAAHHTADSGGSTHGHVVAHSLASSCPISINRSSSTSAGSCGSCSPASTHSGSGCTSDGVSITLDMGEIRASGAGGGDFRYNEESFQARLRAKQLGAAGAALPVRW